MNNIPRRHFLAALGASALSACAAPQVVSRAAPTEGGIGGTGIVGLLTDFGSLMVNGLRVQLGSSTRVYDAFGPMPLGDLQIGQALTIEAQRSDTGIIAQTVRFSPPLVGQVAPAIARGAAFSVNGTDVRLEPGAIGHAVPGTVVAVSGAWRDDHVVATRIDPAPRASRASLAGDVVQDATGAWRMGTTPLQFANTSSLLPRKFMTLTGDYTPTGFTVATQETGRFRLTAPELRQLSVEGYLTPAPIAPGLRISGLGHKFDPSARVADFAPFRTLFVGPYQNGFRVENALALPEDFNARRSMMAQIQTAPETLPFRSTRP